MLVVFLCFFVLGDFCELDLYSDTNYMYSLRFENDKYCCIVNISFI